MLKETKTIEKLSIIYWCIIWNCRLSKTMPAAALVATSRVKERGDTGILRMACQKYPFLTTDSDVTTRSVTSKSDQCYHSSVTVCQRTNSPKEIISIYRSEIISNTASIWCDKTVPWYSRSWSSAMLSNQLVPHLAIADDVIIYAIIDMIIEDMSRVRFNHFMAVRHNEWMAEWKWATYL